MLLNSNKSNFKNLKYLEDCDFINKYNLKTSYEIPTLTRIKISFPLAKFVKTFEVKKKKLMHLYKIPYLFLYMYFASILKIRYNSKVQDYTLEVNIINLQSINQFLFLIFVENQNCFYQFNGLPKLVQYQKNNIINYTYKFSSLLLTGIQEILNIFFPFVNLKRFFMYINFFFKISKKFKRYQGILQNKLFFCFMGFKK